MQAITYTRRFGDAGTAGISPVGYYRLGQSYPRERARQAYPGWRRRVVLEVQESATTGPFFVDACGHYLAGAVAQGHYLAGVVEHDTYCPVDAQGHATQECDD